MASETSLDNSKPIIGEAETVYYFANKIGRILFLAMEDVAGRESMRAILTSARLQGRLANYPPNDFAPEFAFDELGCIQQAMEELYGPSNSRRLGRRIGRACFRIGVEDLRPVLGIADGLFRILPLRMRIRVGFEVLAQMFDRFSDQTARVEETDEHFRWISAHCGVCWGRHTDTPCCDLTVGLLEEALYWLSGGASFFIEESTCIAAGDATCTILIGKTPLDRGASPED